MLAITFVTSLAGYLASTLVFYLALVRQRAASTTFKWAQRLLVGSAVVHATDIVARGIVLHACPLLSAAFALSFAAWVTVVGFLLWARLGRLLALGVIVSPLAIGMMVASLVLLGQGMAPELPGWFLALHVLANLAAVALFVLSAAAALAYLFLARRLKSKRPALAQNAFPGLSTLESLIQRTLTIGLGPMTLGIVSGAAFAERLTHGGVESLRIGLAYSCWLLAAGIVVGQRLIGWSGRKLAWGALLVAAVTLAVVVLYSLARGGAA